MTHTIEKTELALELEKKLNISWDLRQASNYDAGYDLRACILNPILLGSFQRYLIPTGLKIQLCNHEWEIEIRSRSGLAAKNGIFVLNSPGTIDYGYRLEIGVILYNTTVVDFIISPGDRIAQACFRKIPQTFLVYGKIQETDRGGFGSTGVK